MANDDKLYEWWKRNVPADARLYTQTLFGDRTKPFTEKDFTPSELKNFEGIIKASKPRLEAGLIKQQAEANRATKDAQNVSSLFSSDNAKKMLNMIKKDPEWQQLSTMHNKYLKEGELQIPDKYSNQYAILANKIGDRYKNFGIGWDGIKAGLEASNNIPQVFNNLLNNHYAINYAKEVADKASKNEQYINQGTGNVQYPDYRYALDKKYVGSLQETPTTVLGRFQYKTDPTTGQRQIIDNYDFSNSTRDNSVDAYEKMGPIKKAANVLKNGLFGSVEEITGMPLLGEIGNAYIGKNGRPVDIKYDPNMIEKKKGGFIVKPIKGGKKDI
jgi:hypothetical protein